VVKGNIAIPGRDPKTWRAKGRKRKSATVTDLPRIVETKSPQELAREKRRRRIIPLPE
jgi:hypothetical protein